MNEGKAEPNRYAGKSDGRDFRGGPDDHIKKEERRDRFKQKAGDQTVFAGAKVAIAVRGKPVWNPARLTGRDEIKHRTAATMLATTWAIT